MQTFAFASSCAHRKITLPRHTTLPFSFARTEDKQQFFISIDAMGKRTMNPGHHPDLMDPKSSALNSKRRFLASSQNSAALTLLSLKKESLNTTPSVAAKQHHGFRMYCDLVTFDRRQRSNSVCSSVTADDDDDMDDDLTISNPTTGSKLVCMALRQPNLRLAGMVGIKPQQRSHCTFPFPEGRPLQPPPRLPPKSPSFRSTMPSVVSN